MTWNNLANLFKSERTSLRKFLYRFDARVPVDDIAQESFARLCAVDLGVVKSPRSYLFETARNLALNDIARRKRSPFLPISVSEAEDVASAPGEPHGAEAEAEAADRWRLADAAIAALPEHLRMPLLMHKLEQIPQAEIALRLGVSERTVKRRIAEALVRCHKSIRDATAAR